MRRLLIALAALLALAGPARAQTELDLRDAFEGKSVTVRIDLPGSDNGIDVFPARRPTLDFPEYARRIKRYGTAVRKGDEIMVTKIRVKKDHIEFQLGGGGYGTFGDDTSPNVSVDSADKTQREKNLEQDLKREVDPAKRRRIKEELDDLRNRRERENTRNQAAVAAAREEKERNIRQRRLEGGSRINVSFDQRVPDGALTPGGLRTALEEWIDFDAAPTAQAEAPAPPALGLSALAKGMSRADVERALGPAVRSLTRKEGTLQAESAEFRTDTSRIDALFVEGVLVRYTIASR